MTMETRFEWHGVAVTERMRAGGVHGLELAAEALLQKTRARVPLEEGTLERSGVASVDESRLTGAVSYDTVYAVYQHEKLELRHAPGRTAKYVEEPLLENHAALQEIIAAQIRRAL